MARKEPTPRQASAPKTKRLTRKQFDKLPDDEVRALAQHRHLDGELPRDEIASALFGTRKQINITPPPTPSPPPSPVAVPATAPAPAPVPSTSEAQPSQTIENPVEFLKAVRAEQDALEAQIADAQAQVENYTQQRVALGNEAYAEQKWRDKLLMALADRDFDVAETIAEKAGIGFLKGKNGKTIPKVKEFFSGQRVEPDYAIKSGRPHPGPPSLPRLDENGNEVDAWLVEKTLLTASEYAVASAGCKRARSIDRDEEDDGFQGDDEGGPQQKRRKSSPHPRKDPAIKGKGRASTPLSPTSPVTRTPVDKGKGKALPPPSTTTSPLPPAVDKGKRKASPPPVEQAPAPERRSSKRGRSLVPEHEDEEAEGPATRAKRTRFSSVAEVIGSSSSKSTQAVAGPSGSQSTAGPSGSQPVAGPSTTRPLQGPIDPSSLPSNFQHAPAAAPQARSLFDGWVPPPHTGNTPPLPTLSELEESSRESSPAPVASAPVAAAPVAAAPVAAAPSQNANPPAVAPGPLPGGQPLRRQGAVYFDLPDDESDASASEDNQAPVASTSNGQATASTSDVAPIPSTAEVAPDTGANDDSLASSEEDGLHPHPEEPTPPEPPVPEFTLEEQLARAAELAERETLDQLVIGNRRRLQELEHQHNTLRFEQEQIERKQAFLRRRRDLIAMSEHQMEIGKVVGDGAGYAAIDDVLEAIREQDEWNVVHDQSHLAPETLEKGQTEGIMGDLPPFTEEVRKDTANRQWWEALLNWRMFRLEDHRRRVRAEQAAKAGVDVEKVEGAKYVRPTEDEIDQLVEDKAELVRERYQRAEGRRALRIVHKKTGFQGVLEELEEVWPYDYWPEAQEGEEWFMDGDFSDVGDEEEREIEAVMREGEMEWHESDWAYYREDVDYQPVFRESDLWETH